MDFTSSKTVTLTDFIFAEQMKHAGASGTFSNVLLSIALGTKIVSRGVNRAGMWDMHGAAGSTNVQGEQVQKLDVYADKVFETTLGRSGEFMAMVSEEREDMFAARMGDSSSQYVIAFDPLDGSSNIDVNVSIGTIFGVYRRLPETEGSSKESLSDFQQPGTAQVAAGYTIYGSSTMFVFTTGSGVNGFTLYPTIGEFILTHPNMQIPEVGKIYSCNEAYFARWSKGVQQYLRKCKDGDGSDEKSKYSMRYVGSLVADFHRTLLKGGIFMYPGDAKNPNGKLRLLYECAPLAFIVEQAGGRAINGVQRIMDLTPENIHQRTPLFIGSRQNVDEVEAAIAAHG
ncbi:MAG: class 1 fructose-bisphosphatase [Bdellovibrionales bacterium]|nr:class 1 fructose-bisphosphatase [Bdellovibrionales bacterium]